MTTRAFSSFDAERQLADDLTHHGRRIFDGSTDVCTRKQRARAAIVAANVADRIIARTAEIRSETFAQAFERIYREPLTPITKPKGK